MPQAEFAIIGVGGMRTLQEAPTESLHFVRARGPRLFFPAPVSVALLLVASASGEGCKQFQNKHMFVQLVSW